MRFEIDPARFEVHWLLVGLLVILLVTGCFHWLLYWLLVGFTGYFAGYWLVLVVTGWFYWSSQEIRT